MDHFFRKPLYEAEAIIQIKETQLENSSLMKPWWANSNPLLLQSALIKSRIILKPVVQSLGLASKKKPVDLVIQALSHNIQLTALSDEKKLNNMQQPQSDIGQLSIKNINREKAIHILNTIIAELERYHMNNIMQESTRLLKLTQNELIKAKHAMFLAESNVNNYQDKKSKLQLKYKTQYLSEELNYVYKKLADIDIQQIDMEQNYTPKHPQFMLLLHDKEVLKKNKQQLLNQLRLLPKMEEQTHLNLIRELDSKTALYTRLLNKIQEIKLIQAGLINPIRILSTATASTHPLPQHSIRIYGLSIILGLMLSICIVFARRLLWPRIDMPDWSKIRYQIQNVATIPHLKKSLKTKILTNLDHSNPTYNALCNLRTHIQLNLRQTPYPIIACIGLAHGIGKTFITANIAYLLATTGKRILLIDGDLRGGMLHQLFDLLPSPGFSDLLQNEKLENAVLQPSQYPNLTILSRGTYHPDPAALLCQDRCRLMMKSLFRQFDIIIIDTSPLLWTHDALLISTLATQNYLIIGAHCHHPTDMDTQIQRLYNINAVMSGTIFNYSHQSTRNIKCNMMN